MPFNGGPQRLQSGYTEAGGGDMEGNQSRMLGRGRVLVCYGKVKDRTMVYEALG